MLSLRYNFILFKKHSRKKRYHSSSLTHGETKIKMRSFDEFLFSNSKLFQHKQIIPPRLWTLRLQLVSINFKLAKTDLSNRLFISKQCVLLCLNFLSISFVISSKETKVGSFFLFPK